MECTTSDDLYGVHWIIKNFSCWNGEIQNTPLTTRRSDALNGDYMELYPKGPSGHDDHLVVRFFGIRETHGIASLSYIGPDGSILCSQEIVGKYVEKYVLELPPGPRFEDAVAQIRRYELTHMDQLTVRVTFKYFGEDFKVLYQLHSVLNVFETSLKISFTSNDVASFVEDYSVEYPSKDGGMECLLMEISSDSFLTLSKVQFKIKSLPLIEKVAVNIFVLLKNIDGSVLRTEERDHVFRKEEYWMFSNSLTRDEITKGVSVFINFKITPSDSFKHLNSQIISLKRKTFSIIRTKISRPLGVNSTEDLNEMNADQPDKNLRKISKKRPYQDKDFSDFELKCGDVSIPVHKAILGARSPVFKTMLSTDMKEAASSEADIKDLDPSTLARFLAFFYTGAVGDLQYGSALKLYYVADKYQVPTLRREYVSVLSAQVSISNVCDILSLANQHQDEEILSVAHEFILKNFNEVLSSKEWENLMKRDPFLTSKTVTHFAQKNCVGRINTS